MCARMAGPRGTSSRALCQHELPLQKDLSGSLPRCVLSRKVSFPLWVLSGPIKQQTSSGMTSSPEVPDPLRKGMAPLLCSEETVNPLQLAHHLPQRAFQSTEDIGR